MDPEALNAVFSALADPTRRAILARLAAGDASVGDLAKPFPVSLPTVSRHLDVLEDARLIVREKHAQRRMCRLQGAPLLEAGEWIGRYAAFWEQRLEALDQLVRELAAEAAPESEA